MDNSRASRFKSRFQTPRVFLNETRGLFKEEDFEKKITTAKNVLTVFNCQKECGQPVDADDWRECATRLLKNNSCTSLPDKWPSDDKFNSILDLYEKYFSRQENQLREMVGTFVRVLTPYTKIETPSNAWYKNHNNTWVNCSVQKRYHYPPGEPFYDIRLDDTERQTDDTRLRAHEEDERKNVARVTGVTDENFLIVHYVLWDGNLPPNSTAFEVNPNECIPVKFVPEHTVTPLRFFSFNDYTPNDIVTISNGKKILTELGANCGTQNHSKEEFFKCVADKINEKFVAEEKLWKTDVAIIAQYIYQNREERVKNEPGQAQRFCDKVELCKVGHCVNLHLKEGEYTDDIQKFDKQTAWIIQVMDNGFLRVITSPNDGYPIDVRKKDCTYQNSLPFPFIPMSYLQAYPASAVVPAGLNIKTEFGRPQYNQYKFK